MAANADPLIITGTLREAGDGSKDGMSLLNGARPRGALPGSAHHGLVAKASEGCFRTAGRSKYRARPQFGALAQPRHSCSMHTPTHTR